MLLDLTDQKFGRLTVISRSKRNKFNHTTWNCICECGTQKEVSTICLRQKLVKSCGCIRRELGYQRVATVMNAYKHGRHATTEYTAWRTLLDRCLNTHSKDYPKYGGRGIVVCARWRINFILFFEDMGLKPSSQHSLDRIDNDGPYSPENCRWATRKQQQRNRRNNHLITFRGETRALAEWAEHFGLSWNMFYNRIRRGWDIERIISTPKRNYPR